MDLFNLMQQRRSVRAFSDRPVARADVEALLRCAGRAPSAINVQPWEYVVTHGVEKERLVRRLLKAREERRVTCGPGTAAPLPESFAGRSRDTARAMRPVVEATGTPFDEFIEAGS